MGNRNLLDAKKAKNDEFYTLLEDIEKELQHYTKHFKDKVVYCNCDNPYKSNFFKYFVLHFNELQLKKLICTCYSGPIGNQKQLSLFGEQKEELPKRIPYKAVVTKVEDYNNDGVIDDKDIEMLLEQDGIVTVLNEDGDFRSQECVELLKSADIVVTNPPFSLFREYITQLIQYDKKFLIIGNLNMVASKYVFQMFQYNKVWIGYNHVNKFIDVCSNINKFGNICWYTNIDIQKKHKYLELNKKYDSNIYLHYDNYDAINVDSIQDIPHDYWDVIGVPVTFLEKYNEQQFEIIAFGISPELFTPSKKYTGLVRHNIDGSTTREHIACNQKLTIALDVQPNDIYCTADNVSNKFLIVPYNRILIKRKQ